MSASRAPTSDGRRSHSEAAGAELTDVVKWMVLLAEGADLLAGFAALSEVWPPGAAPPVVTAAIVSGLANPGGLVEIEPVAAVARHAADGAVGAGD
jgi:enamine deaminase RidA (YjgF/YER057c/UK114 family)